MRKSKKAALAIVSKILDNAELHKTHMKRSELAHDAMMESFRELKWIVEAVVPLLPPEQYTVAVQSVNRYIDRLLNMAEADEQVARDIRDEAQLYIDLVHTIPERLWEKA